MYVHIPYVCVVFPLQLVCVYAGKGALGSIPNEKATLPQLVSVCIYIAGFISGDCVHTRDVCLLALSETGKVSVMARHFAQ